MNPLSVPFFAVALMLFAAQTRAADATVEVPAPVGAAELTIYTNDLALVRERRTFRLSAVPARLAFGGVSSRLQPETAILQVLKGSAVKIVEQSFNFDVLTPAKLLERAVGRDVTVLTINPATGAEIQTRAKVLSIAGGVVLEMGGKIHTNIPGRIAFDGLPPGVRPAPTLFMMATGSPNQDVDAELSYLTGGISWRADYVAQYDPDAARMDLTAWATITNATGQDFKEAKVKLISGAVSRALPPQFEPSRPVEARAMAAGAPTLVEGVVAQPLVGNHIYAMPAPTTLPASESRQLALLSAQDVVVKREFAIRGEPGIYATSIRGSPQAVRAEMELTFKNDAASKLGAPLPAGIVRVYTPDAQGAPQFMGEARIDHVAEGSEAVVNMGADYDLPGSREQTNYVRASDTITISSWRVTVKNSKPKPVAVRVIESLPGAWEILKESQPHKKLNAATAEWVLQVPAKGQTVLEYNVKTQF